MPENIGYRIGLNIFLGDAFSRDKRYLIKDEELLFDSVIDVITRSKENYSPDDVLNSLASIEHFHLRVIKDQGSVRNANATLYRFLNRYINKLASESVRIIHG